jgi:tRNA nucleotidyltransferase (CCA-adding enzyme)
LRENWPPQASDELLTLFERADAFRRPQRLEEALTGVACILEDPVGKKMMLTHLQALRAANGIDAGKIASETAERSQIPQGVRSAREAAIRQILCDLAEKSL